MELRLLLDVLVLLSCSFGALSVLTSWLTTDQGSFVGGILLGVAALSFGLTRASIARWSIDASVCATVAIIFVLGAAMAWVQPMYSAITIVPLLAVGVALPYLRGTVLRTIMMVRVSIWSTAYDERWSRASSNWPINRSSIWAPA